MCPIKVTNFKICRLCNEQGPYNYRNTKFASIFLWGWSLLYYILWKLSHLVLLLYWNTCILKHGYIVLSWLSRLNPMNLHVFIHNLLYVLLYKEFFFNSTDHRSTDAVYIGLHVPKRKHRRKRHKHRKVEGDKTQSSQPEIFKDGNQNSLNQQSDESFFMFFFFRPFKYYDLMYIQVHVQQYMILS